MNRRLVMVVPTFPKLSETFIVNKFLGLLDKGWDIHVVCTRSDKSEWDFFPQLAGRSGVQDRVHLSPLSDSRAGALLRLPWMLVVTCLCAPKTAFSYLRWGWKRFGPAVFRLFYLDARLIALAPDLVHFEFGALAAGRMHLGELLKCRVTSSFRGYDLNFSGLDKPDYYSEVWGKVDGLHLLGEDLWRRAQGRGCPAEMRHALIPPALDVGHFTLAERCLPHRFSPERPLRILSVGRLEWKKGYEYALEAVKNLVDRGLPVQYRIVGAGEYFEALCFARYQMGLESEVQFLGGRPQAEIVQHLAWADLFLHAAVSEGFCNAVIEAQAMQVPVVCSDADGLGENVVDGVTGFVVPRRNPGALVEKLALLAEDPTLRRRLGEAGRQRVLTNFRLEDQIAQFDRFFQEVLGEE